MTFSKCALALGAVGVVCATHVLDGQRFSTYRQFELGSDVAAVSAAAGIPASAAKVVHQRPALLQDLEWRPSRWVAGSITASTDPVSEVDFSFYNDQLFQIVVNYGVQWTEGMTPADLVEAISVVYGAPSSGRARNPARAASQVEVEAGSPIARWGEAGNQTVVLYRTSSYQETFRLIVTDTARADLAAKADTEARRLDDREAPQRELAREKKARDDEREAAAKARLANKGDFQP